jgi:hypothetical protein
LRAASIARSEVMVTNALSVDCDASARRRALSTISTARPAWPA